MSAQSQPSTGIKLSPIISRASLERENRPNGSPSAPSSSIQPERHHIGLNPFSRATKSGSGNLGRGHNEDAVQKNKVSQVITAGENTTQIPFHASTVGTLDIDGVISVDNSRDKRNGATTQGSAGRPPHFAGTARPGPSSPRTVRLELGHADFHTGLPKSPPSRTTTNPALDYFVPRRPTHQATSFSTNASRWGRERLWGHHRPRPHHTNTNPINGAEQDNSYERRKHYNESDEKQREYWEIIEKLDSSEHKARTVRFDDFVRGLRAQDSQDREAGRAAVIEFSEDGHSEARKFSKSEALRDYFNGLGASKDTTQGSNPPPPAAQQSHSGSPASDGSTPTPTPRRRIFILEDLPLNYLTVLGSRLHIHPDVFASQYSCDQGWAFTHSLAFLPPGAHEKRRFKLRYSTLMSKTYVQLNRVKPCPPWLIQGGPEDWFNPKFNVVRGLETPFDNGDWDHRGKHAELEGQVNYWARTDDKGGWDVLLLVDPRFQEPDPVDFDVKRPVETENPFTTHDKVDRINRYPRLNDEYDLPEDLKTWTLPSKHDIPSMNSLYHDILLHYQSKENTLEHITDKPSDCTWIIRRFVIKKWISYINHLHTCFWHCRGELFSAPDEDGIGTKYSPIWAPAWTEWIYTRLQSWGSDLEIYRIDIESNMHNLGIDHENPKCTGRVSQEEAAQWRYIQSSLLKHKAMLKTVADNYVQVIGLRETQTSTQQAREVGKLTVLGTVFVPLSIISGILSMGGSYLPGERKFWVYLAIALPVLACLTVCLLTNFLPWLLSWADWVWHLRKRYKITHDIKENGLLPRFHVRPILKEEGREKWSERK